MNDSICSDAIFLSPALSEEAKLVLGFSINYPKLNPSLSELEEVARLRRSQVISAQNELEAEGVVEYDRPEHFYDRCNPDDPRFDRSNKIVIHPLADPFRTTNHSATASVPPKIIKQLPRARKNVGTFILFASSSSASSYGAARFTFRATWSAPSSA